MNIQALREHIRDIPDFPQPGIVFKDITPLLADASAFHWMINVLSDHYESAGVDLVMGAEARGFILAGALAYRLNAGFIPARKPGKLPYQVAKAEYALEYGTDTLEIHEDAIRENHRVLIVDDVLATGGTAAAKVQLIESLGGTVVGMAFLIELAFLGGRDKLDGHDVYSLIQY